MREKPDEAIRSELKRLELLLMDPAVRRDRERVNALLATDFVEFGSSGRAWTREEILHSLEGESGFTAPRVEDFEIRWLGTGVVLVTYRTFQPRTLREGASGGPAVTLRSSIWTLESGGWRICFHQGTRDSGDQE